DAVHFHPEILLVEPDERRDRRQRVVRIEAERVDPELAVAPVGERLQRRRAISGQLQSELLQPLSRLPAQPFEHVTTGLSTCLRPPWPRRLPCPSTPDLVARVQCPGGLPERDQPEVPCEPLHHLAEPCPLGRPGDREIRLRPAELGRQPIL